MPPPANWPIGCTSVSRNPRLLLWAACGLLLVSSPLWGPPLLSRVGWFEVRRVEISGTRLLAPHQVLAASRVRAGNNVWDDPAAWERALRAHPAIAGATISRKLPHTLRIRVEEKRPVAFVEAAALAPVTARGEILPLDPTRTPVDLPVIRGNWERLRPAQRALLLREADRLGQLDPALLAGVSEIRAAERSPGVVVLSHRLAEITLPAGAGPRRLAELRAVLRDLEHRIAPGSVPAQAQVDLRYGDQVIVRLPSSV